MQDQNDGGRINTKEEVEAYILHHIKDSHDFSLFSYTSDDGERKHIGFPLPVILWSSEGLVSFMSSEFHHNDDGHVIVEKNGLKFAKIHSKIYELDKGAATVSFDETHHATNAHKVLDFSITKSVVGILLIGFLLLFWFSRLAKQYKTKQIPTGFARVLEPLVLYVRDEIARPNIGEKHYRRFTGYLLTVFFFIWVLNLAGLTPLGFNVTGQLAVTGCLAIFTLVIYTVSGNKGVLDAHDLDARSTCFNTSSIGNYRISWCFSYQTIFTISTFVRKHFSRSYCGNELNCNYVYSKRISRGCWSNRVVIGIIIFYNIN